MLDEREDAARHEPRPPHGFARTGHLRNLDNASAGGDLDAPTGTSGDDLVGARAIIDGNDDFDSIALHRRSVLPRG